MLPDWELKFFVGAETSVWPFTLQYRQVPCPTGMLLHLHWDLGLSCLCLSLGCKDMFCCIYPLTWTCLHLAWAARTCSAAFTLWTGPVLHLPWLGLQGHALLHLSYQLGLCCPHLGLGCKDMLCCINPMTWACLNTGYACTAAFRFVIWAWLKSEVWCHHSKHIICATYF